MSDPDQPAEGTRAAVTDVEKNQEKNVVLNSCLWYSCHEFRVDVANRCTQTVEGFWNLVDDANRGKPL
jgi:hypothetical protein